MPKLTKGLKALRDLTLEELEAIEIEEKRNFQNGEKNPKNRQGYKANDNDGNKTTNIDASVYPVFKPKYSQVWRKFVRHFENTGANVSKTCQECKVDVVTFYAWKKRHPEFAEAVEKAKFGYLDYLDDNLEEYVRQPQLNTTRLTAVVTKLKAKHPDYRKPIEVDLTPTYLSMKGISKDEAINTEVETRLRALGIIDVDPELPDPDPKT